jgi:hypothetical protein
MGSAEEALILRSKNMNVGPIDERLSRIRADLDRWLDSYLRGAGVSPSGMGVEGEMAGKVDGALGPVATLASSGSDGYRPQVNVNVSLKGGTIVLDDERRTRALAKEIKRLIIEDIKRGVRV